MTAAAIALAGLVGAAAVVPLGESPRAEEKSMTTTPEKSKAAARASATASTRNARSITAESYHRILLEALGCAANVPATRDGKGGGES